MTLTTRGPASAEGLGREFRNRFIRRLAFDAERDVRWFYAVERTHDAHTHVHALLYGTEQLAIREVQRAWSLGFTAVDTYSPELAGSFYVTKHCDRLDAWDFSRRLRPYRPST